MPSIRPSWAPTDWSSLEASSALADAVERGATTIPRLRGLVARGGEPALDAIGAEMLRVAAHPFASSVLAELLARSGRPRDVIRLVTYFAIAPEPTAAARALSACGAPELPSVLRAWLEAMLPSDGGVAPFGENPETSSAARLTACVASLSPYPRLYGAVRSAHGAGHGGVRRRTGSDGPGAASRACAYAPADPKRDPRLRVTDLAHVAPSAKEIRGGLPESARRVPEVRNRKDRIRGELGARVLGTEPGHATTAAVVVAVPVSLFTFTKPRPKAAAPAPFAARSRSGREASAGRDRRPRARSAPGPMRRGRAHRRRDNARTRRRAGAKRRGWRGGGDRAIPAEVERGSRPRDRDRRIERREEADKECLRTRRGTCRRSRETGNGRDDLPPSGPPCSPPAPRTPTTQRVPRAPRSDRDHPPLLPRPLDRLVPRELEPPRHRAACLARVDDLVH